MIVSRRTLLGATLTLPWLARPTVGIAQDGTPSEPLPVDGMEQFDPLPEGFNDGLFRTPDVGLNFGSVTPPAVYVALAGILLRGAPWQCRPIDVAYYFANLRERKVPDPVLKAAQSMAQQAMQPGFADPAFLSIFAYDWERNQYFNPVVIGFFQGNNLKPYAGDQTPWCAAFVNWCISRSRATSPSQIVFAGQIKAFGTRNASSGSFRCWGSDVKNDAQEGDIIVWAKSGTVTGHCPSSGQGHVAFFCGTETTPGGQRRYRVVGGNQGFRGSPSGSGSGAVVKPQDVAQAVSYRTIGNGFGDRVLHSIRTAPYLR